MLFLLFLSAISTPFAMAQAVSSECGDIGKTCAGSFKSRLEECIPGYVAGQPAPPDDKITEDVKKCLCNMNGDLLKW
jgi:hypothetical protein